MNSEDAKRVVRDGYDRVSESYRADDFALSGTGYERWLTMLTPHLNERSRVLDLGCGCGIPVAKALATRHQVTGVDLSPVQVERAQRLVPDARFVCADMTDVRFDEGSFDAVIHRARAAGVREMTSHVMYCFLVPGREPGSGATAPAAAARRD